jgi:hypothetical protein
MWKPVAMEGLLKIFTFDKKRDLEKHCREITIHRGDLATLILTCQDGLMPFRHRIYRRDYVPRHLRPSQKEREALANNGVGPVTGDALKMVQKIEQLFQDRRHLVGHMFDTPGSPYWHFLYFDQRDLKDDGTNHWKQGAHVHLVNWLLRPQSDPETLWAEFTNGNMKLGGSLHIRFADDRVPAESGEMS